MFVCFGLKQYKKKKRRRRKKRTTKKKFLTNPWGVRCGESTVLFAEAFATAETFVLTEVPIIAEAFVITRRLVLHVAHSWLTPVD